MNFPGTNIPCRVMSKSELASYLGISATTLRGWRRKADISLYQIPGYNPRCTLLSPREVEIVLIVGGVLKGQLPSTTGDKME